MIAVFYDYVAVKVGVNAAVLLSYIDKMNEYSEANREKESYYNGRYWWTASASEIGKCLPYLSEKQIRTALNKLINRGYIIAACKNVSSYDRTLSYTLTEKGRALISGKEV